MQNQKLQHDGVIKAFLKELNSNTSQFVLKGGTALKQCYNLDRFSEDIDLDAVNVNIKGIVKNFCQKNNYDFIVKKDTALVKRYMINYEAQKLKIEVSYRRKNIPEDECTTLNNIRVYKINPLTVMKATAYAGRDKIRDLYDLSFICEKYFSELTEPTKLILQNVVQYKGIEQCDYLLKTQKDNLVDENKLVDKFLNMYEKLELRVDKAHIVKKEKNKNINNAR